jgi:ABC-2 type transport system permease protein
VVTPIRGPAGRAQLELLGYALRRLQRSLLVWASALTVYVLVIVSFWPSLHHAPGLRQLLRALPLALSRAFGLANLASPAGYLLSELFSLVLPALLIAAAVAATLALTAGDEDAGVLEPLLALPVSRKAVMVERGLAVVGFMLALGLVVEIVLTASGAVVHLGLPAANLSAGVAALVALALLHAAVAFAAAGIGARRPTAMGITVGVGVAGYFLNALGPLNSALSPWRRLSPWDWALGNDPLQHGWSPGGLMLLLAVVLILATAGIVGLARRDIRSA